MQLSSCFAAARARAADIDRSISFRRPHGSAAGSVNAVSRGGSAKTCLCVCVKADSQAEMDGWIDAVHLSCAASYARHLGRDGTAKLLRAEIHKLENSIDLVSVSRWLAAEQCLCISMCTSRLRLLSLSSSSSLVIHVVSDATFVDRSRPMPC